MEFRFLLRGILIGFPIAAPVGPIGELCIRRTRSGGLAGFGLICAADFPVGQRRRLPSLTSPRP